jgi:hypothetical protein
MPLTFPPSVPSWVLPVAAGAAAGAALTALAGLGLVVRVLGSDRTLEEARQLHDLAANDIHSPHYYRQNGTAN